MTSNSRLIYLGAPYTHKSTATRAARFDAVTRAAASLIRKGLIVYSPLTMTHPIDLVLAGADNTLGSDYWVKFDETFMRFCTEIIVLRLQGWEASSGVKREISFFRAKNEPVTFIDPDGKEIPDVPI